MKRRILVATMTVTTIVVLLFAVPLGFVLQRLLNDRAVLALEHRADLAARSIDLTATADQPDATEFPAGPEHFALYSTLGTRRIGTGPARLDTDMLAARSGNTVTKREAGQLVTAVPIVSGENILGFVRAERSLSAIRRTTRRAIALLAAGALGVLAIGWFLARRLATRISSAATALRDAAVRLGSGDFTARVAPVGIGELDDIALALSFTARELDDLVAREQAFSADASHQLRTPIAGLRAALETELAFPRADRQAVVHESLADLARLERTVSDLLTLARTERDTNATIDAFAVATEARDHWHGAFARSGRALTLRCATEPTLAYGQTALLRQAFDALLDNALTHGAGRTTIELHNDANAATGTLTIAISDEGPGFPEGTTGAAGTNGSGPEESGNTTAGGIGLPLTRRLVRAQGGRLIIGRARPHPVLHVVLRAPV